MKYEEVKSCPFCGGYAKLEEKSKTIIKQELRYVTYVRCVHCDARSARFTIEEDTQLARQLAIESWNRRV